MDARVKPAHDDLGGLLTYRPSAKAGTHRATYHGLWNTGSPLSRGRQSSAFRHNPICARPAQAVLGLCARPIFAADPAAVAGAVEGREDLGIIDLALVRLVARGHRGDLHVRDMGQMLLEPSDQVAADDLGVIEVELDAQVRVFYLRDDVGRLLGAGEEIVRAVARVDRLDQQRDVRRRGPLGRLREIADEGPLRRRALLGLNLAGEAMDLAAADQGDVVER